MAIDNFIPDPKSPQVYVAVSEDQESVLVQLVERLEEPHLSRLKVVVKNHRLRRNEETTSLSTSFFRVNALLADLHDAKFLVRLSPSLIDYFKAKVGKEELAAQLAEQTMSRVEEWSKEPLRDYQKTDVRWMHTVTAGINANEQRTGKSRELCCVFKQAGNIVIGPLAAVDVWVQEVRKTRKDLRPVVIPNAAKFRWPKYGEVVILHYDAVPQSGLKMAAKHGHRPKVPKAGLLHIKDSCPSGIVLTFDECQWIKNPKAERTKRCKALSDIVASKNGIRWLVTGTPVPNRRKELGDFLNFLGVFYTLFPQGQDWFIKADETEDDYIASVLSRVMVRRLRKDVIAQLPRVTRETIPVPTPADCKSQLDIMWQKAVDLGILDDPENLIETLQIHPYFTVYSKIRSALAKAKIPLMMAWVEEMEESEERGVVISAHKAPVEALAVKENWAFIHGGIPPKFRQELITEFKQGKLRGLGLTIRTGGMAIDLSQAQVMLVVDQDWVPGNNAQAEDRIVNVSKSDPLLYRYLVIDHPLEMHVHSVLRYKQEQITRLDTVGNKCDDPSRSIRENKSILQRVEISTRDIIQKEREKDMEDAFVQALESGF